MKRPTLRTIDRRLQRIEAMLLTVIKMEVVEMKELDDLTVKVQETTDIEQSAIALLNGLSAQIAALKDDPAALQALSEKLSAKSSELASAITANTPAA